ncbi:MAG: uracil-DNA glycosylase family protein [Oscillibacter sp.]|nr:uracil-DNA glycosylase family protein [Oscillibacter sp.]
MELLTELHPLEPFFPAGAKLLMLGSFPPQKNRWSMDFYYPNLQNDMWRIIGLIFYGNKDYFLLETGKAFCKDRICRFLEEKGIALSDAAGEVIRQKGNASDKFLEVVTPIDIQKALQQLPDCRAIVTTGQKATDTLLELLPAEEPKVGGYCEFDDSGRRMRLYRMPSSSRAYPKPLHEKAAVYEQMFRELGLL